MVLALLPVIADALVPPVRRLRPIPPPPTVTAAPLPTTAAPTPFRKRAGWLTVPSSRESVSYEVPDSPEWAPKPSLLIGYETRSGVLVIANTASVYLSGSCPDYAHGRRAFVGLNRSAAARPNPAATAALLVSRWAQARNTESDDTRYPVPTPELRTVTGVAGTLQVASITFTPQVTDAYSCLAPRMRFTVALLTSAERDYPMIIVSDQGVPNALTPELEDRIIATLLPG